MTSLFTGMHPQRHGVFSTRALTAEADTLAELLSQNGWRTGGFSLNAHVSEQTKLAQGFGDFFEDFDTSKHRTHAHELFARARVWLTARGEDPFFLYLQPMNVHGPYVVPKTDRSLLLGRPPRTEFRFYDELMTDIMREGKIERRHEVDGAILTSLVERYDTAIRYTTDELDALFAFLEQQNLYDESLIIVTADHGEELFDHGGFTHGYSLYDEVLRVPLFVKLPRQRHSRIAEQRVSLTDLFSTILEATDLSAPETVDGRSLVPLLQHQQQSVDWPGKNELYRMSWEKRYVARAVIRWPYKLINVEDSYEGPHDQLLLFDLERDPAEKHNLVEIEPDETAELEHLLAKTSKELSGAHLYAVETDDVEKKSLEALGYFQHQ